MGMADSIRTLNMAVPFVPYLIEMVGGAKYRVPHADFISVSPGGNWVIFYDAQDHMRLLNPILIERVTPRPAVRRRGRRAA
jgi:hypothetical protein